jgi:hypothetical protein
MYVSIILNIYKAYREAFQLSPLEDKSTVKLEHRLHVALGWSELAAEKLTKEEPTPLGAAFILIYIFDKRLQVAIKNKEIIDTDKFEELFISAVIIARQIHSDEIIWISALLGEDPYGVAYTLKQLGQARSQFLKAIDYECFPISPKQVIALLERYCDSDTLTWLRKQASQSCRLDTIDYRFLLRINHQTTIPDILTLIRSRTSITELTLLAEMLSEYADNQLQTSVIQNIINIIHQQAIDIAKNNHYIEKSTYAFTLARLVKLLLDTGKQPFTDETRKIIAEVQNRIMMLAYENPYTARVHQKTYLSVLSAYTPDKQSLERVKEFRNIIAIQTEFSPNWHLHFIFGLLREREMLYPFGYSVAEKDMNLFLNVYETLLQISNALLLKDSHKVEIAYLMARYLERCPKAIPIPTSSIVTFYISCSFHLLLSNVSGKRKEELELSLIKFIDTLPSNIPVTKIQYKEVDISYQQFVTSYPEVVESLQHVLQNFLTVELPDASFLQLCGSMMKSQRDRLDTVGLEVISKRIRYHGADMVISVLSCVSSIDQLDQIVDAINGRAFDFLRETGSNPSAFYQSEPTWNKIENTIAVMRTFLTQNYKTTFQPRPS